MQPDRGAVLNTRYLKTRIANRERRLRAKRKRDRAPALYRLAEAYVQLEGYVERDRTRALTLAVQLRGLDPARASRHESEARSLARLASIAGKKAIEHYKTLLREYPNSCAVRRRGTKKKGCPDEVLFALGYQYERLGKYVDAAASYMRLLRNSPRPRFARRARQRLKGKKMNRPAHRPSSKKAYEPGY